MDTINQPGEAIFCWDLVSRNDIETTVTELWFLFYCVCVYQQQLGHGTASLKWATLVKFFISSNTTVTVPLLLQSSPFFFYSLRPFSVVLFFKRREWLESHFGHYTCLFLIPLFVYINVVMGVVWDECIGGLGCVINWSRNNSICKVQQIYSGTLQINEKQVFVPLCAVHYDDVTREQQLGLKFSFTMKPPVTCTLITWLCSSDRWDWSSHWNSSWMKWLITV